MSSIGGAAAMLFGVADIGLRFGCKLRETINFSTAAKIGAGILTLDSACERGSLSLVGLPHAAAQQVFAETEDRSTFARLQHDIFLREPRSPSKHAQTPAQT